MELHQQGCEDAMEQWTNWVARLKVIMHSMFQIAPFYAAITVTMQDCFDNNLPKTEKL